MIERRRLQKEHCGTASKIMSFELYNDDCLKILPQIGSDSVDLILCDLPHGYFDSSIPLDILWKEYHRIAKDDAVFCLFGIQPFTTALISSNLKEYRYKWIWQKESPTGSFNVSHSPMKLTEEICIFSKGTVGNQSRNPIRYFPQGLKRSIDGEGKPSNYPQDILRFARERHQVHPTQKPVSLLEYLIRTYTKENELVLDNCMGSGSTGVAAIRSNRKFIGMEIDPHWFEIAQERIEDIYQKSEIFFL